MGMRGIEEAARERQAFSLASSKARQILLFVNLFFCIGLPCKISFRETASGTQVCQVLW